MCKQLCIAISCAEAKSVLAPVWHATPEGKQEQRTQQRFDVKEGLLLLFIQSVHLLHWCIAKWASTEALHICYAYSEGTRHTSVHHKLVAEGVNYAGLVDKDRVAVMGGSHGGFLTGNLVGQYPGAFKCGVLRNPVMDLGLMIHCSDIPDWTYIEAFGCKVNFPPEQQ